MIRPWHLLAWAAVLLLVAGWFLFGGVGLGVAALIESSAAVGWAWVLTRGVIDGRP